LDDPRALILKAISTLRQGKAFAGGSTKKAKKVLGLLLAASQRASAIGRWASGSPSYDPVPDFIQLQRLARQHLGPPRPAGHIVSQVRAGIDNTLRILGGAST
jgi:hypothetical protein